MTCARPVLGPRLTWCCLWMAGTLGCTADAFSLPDGGATALDAGARPSDGSAPVPDGGACASCDAAAIALAPASFRQRTSLIDVYRFEPLSEADDPFDDRPPQTLQCGNGGYFAEPVSDELVFGVRTGFCPYLTVMQPSLTDVREGELLSARMWHFALTAPQPAEAHMAVTIDGAEEGLHGRIPIPTYESGPVMKSWRAARDYPAGTPIYFHVHNHGDNEYYILELSTGSDDPGG